MGQATVPASDTKGASLLEQRIGKHTFQLHQKDDLHRTGGTLWLGAQVLAAYIFFKYGDRVHSKGDKHQSVHAIELGAGVGLLSLSMFAQGFYVMATDVQDIVDNVLMPNINDNAPLFQNASSLQVQTLDWTQGEDVWKTSKPSYCSRCVGAVCECGRHDFDLIVTSDTIYKPEFVQPLLETMQFLCRPRNAKIVLALERRDSASIDSFLDQASDAGFARVQVKPLRISKALKNAEIRWTREDWAGIEIYEMRLSS